MQSNTLRRWLAGIAGVSLLYVLALGVSFTHAAPDTTFANTTPITIPLEGSASPYPSTINVTGATGRVAAVTVRLLNLSHTYARDLDVLLVAPDGRRILLMSDAGSSLPGHPVASITLTFDDAGPALACGADLVTGTFQPVNCSDGLGNDEFAPPAPAGVSGTNLAHFIGIDPNGPWSLYVRDDYALDQGVISGGWELSLSLSPAPPFTPTATPPVSPTPTATVTPTPTSQPGPPVLVEPAEGATLPQPVPPGEWVFRWTARFAACVSSITILGPNSYQHTAYVPYDFFVGYEYRHTLPTPVADDALGPWYWIVTVFCPAGNASSKPGTFYVQSASTPTPTATPTATATATVTVTPTETSTPTVTATPEPTATPTATATDEPTVTPTPTATDEPTATPTATDEPTATPTSTPTLTPTVTATPTDCVDTVISGRVQVQGRLTSAGVQVGPTITAADGSFAFAATPGLQTVTADMNLYLPGTIEVNACGATVLPDLLLLGGDTDDNGRIDLFDLIRIGAHYGTFPPGDPRADVNGNGIVDLPDLLMVGSNYGGTESPWLSSPLTR